MARLLISAAIAALAVAAPALAVAPALAQDPAADPAASQYEAPLPSAGSAASSAPAAEDSGLRSEIAGLPFTGLDLILLAGIALVITGTGFALQRLSAPRH